MRDARASAFAVLSVVTMLVVGAPEPDLRPCGWNESVIAQFTVADRRELWARVPGFALAPEVSVFETPLQVRVMRCLRSDQIAAYWPLAPDGALPTEFRNLLAITTADDELWLYSEVDPSGSDP